METIHFSNNKFINDNEYINTFVIINNSLISKVDHVNGFSIPFTEIDEYDVIFRAEKITNDDNILLIEGSIGYSFDPTYIELIYNLNENKIYVVTEYRLLDFSKEYELYKDTYQISYDKYWNYEKEKDNEKYILQEKIINDKYQEIDKKSLPYFRFPRTKDGVSIPRLIYNIFKVFSNEYIIIKPAIMIPINLNIYRKIIK